MITASVTPREGRWHVLVDGVDLDYGELEEAVEEARSAVRSSGGGLIEIIEAGAVIDRIRVPAPSPAGTAQGTPRDPEMPLSPGSPVPAAAPLGALVQSTSQSVTLDQIPSMPVLTMREMLAPGVGQGPHLYFAGVLLRRHDEYVEVEARSDYFNVFFYLQRSDDAVGVWLNVSNLLEGAVSTDEGQFGAMARGLLHRSCPHITSLIRDQRTSVDGYALSYLPVPTIDPLGRTVPGFGLLSAGGPWLADRLSTDTLAWAAEGVNAALTVASEWMRYVAMYGSPDVEAAVVRRSWLDQFDDAARAVDDGARIVKGVLEIFGALSG